LVDVSATVSFNVTLLSNSNNNELLFINLATVTGRRISIFPLGKAVAVGGYYTPATNCGYTQLLVICTTIKSVVSGNKY
jgi:hypothetical protein